MKIDKMARTKSNYSFFQYCIHKNIACLELNGEISVQDAHTFALLSGRVAYGYSTIHRRKVCIIFRYIEPHENIVSQKIFTHFRGGNLLYELHCSWTTNTFTFRFPILLHFQTQQTEIS